MTYQVDFLQFSFFLVHTKLNFEHFMMKITITRVKRSIIIIIISSTTMNPNDQKNFFVYILRRKNLVNIFIKTFMNLCMFLRVFLHQIFWENLFKSNNKFRWHIDIYKSFLNSSLTLRHKCITSQWPEDVWVIFLRRTRRRMSLEPWERIIPAYDLLKFIFDFRPGGATFVGS